METKKWWQSRTIWMALVSTLASLAALAGHNISAGQQQALVDSITAIAGGAAVLTSTAAAIYRAKSTTVIGKVPATDVLPEEPAQTPIPSEQANH